MDRTTFDSTYNSNNPGDVFADNSTKDISEGDLRQFAEDIENSVVFSDTILQFKVIQIGDWNMYTTASISVNHGMGSSYKNIRMVSYVIREDADVLYHTADHVTGATLGSNQLAISTINATTINLTRLAGGPYDGADFDSTSYNRGWITILYTT